MSVLDYTQLIDAIHNGDGGELSDTEGIIYVDGKSRKFTLPENFNPVVGTTNDLNCNKLTFRCTRYIDGHDVFKCSDAVIKWSNLASREKGTTSILDRSEVTDPNQAENQMVQFTWVVPREAATRAGTLSIALCFYDVYTDLNAQKETIVYKWNSNACSDLKIEAGLDNVEVEEEAIEEIITLDTESRNFIIPASFQKVVAVTNDFKSTEIVMHTDRFIGALDVLDENNPVIIMIRWANVGADERGTTTITNATSIRSLINSSMDQDQGEMIRISWVIPKEALTAAGKLQFSLCFYQLDNLRTKILSKWNSNICQDLSIGQGLGGADADEEWPVDESQEGVPIVESSALYKMLQQVFGDSPSGGGSSGGTEVPEEPVPEPEPEPEPDPEGGEDA